MRTTLQDTTPDNSARALEHAAGQYAQHTGTVTVGGIEVDAAKQAASYRRMAEYLRAQGR